MMQNLAGKRLLYLKFSTQNCDTQGDTAHALWVTLSGFSPAPLTGAPTDSDTATRTRHAPRATRHAPFAAPPAERQASPRRNRLHGLIASRELQPIDREKAKPHRQRQCQPGKTSTEDGARLSRGSPSANRTRRRVAQTPRCQSPPVQTPARRPRQVWSLSAPCGRPRS